MDKELSLKIKALIQGAKEVADLANETDRLIKTGRQSIPDPTENLRNGAKATKSVVADLGKELLGLVTAGAILRFANDSVTAFATAESAFRGLEAVANASGFGVANALREAERLAADGLISVAEASKGLQNLLARGYSLDQAVATLERLKDSAAFNRAAHLSLGEAVVTASEGLKNENSILVDNAGVTKNVAKMWDDYAAKIGTTTNKLTQQQKIEAEYQGIMAETQAQVGNAEKALEGYQGQMAQADQETLKFTQSLGQLLAPTKLAAAQLGTALLGAIKLVMVGAGGAAIGLGFLARSIGILLTAPFKEIPDAIAREFDAAQGAYDEFGRKILDGNLEIKDSLTGVADEQKILDNQMKRSAADNTAELKKQNQERIKDYEKLRDAIRKAWEDSIQAEKDYLAEAKKLRAEVNAFNVQSLAGSSPQEVATKEISLRGDLRIAQERLQRLVSQGGSVEEIRTQAEAVQQLANQYRSLTEVTEDDRDKAEISQRADEAVKQSKLDLAKALEQAAAEEKLRQQDQIKQLNDIDKVLQTLQEPKTLSVNTDQATQSVNAFKTTWDGIKDKTVTVTVVRVDAANAANFTGATDSQGNAIYRDLPGRAYGGPLPGSAPHDRADNVTYRGTPGEWVIQRPAVRYWGFDFMRAINEMRMPAFAFGGELGSSAASRMSLPAPSLSASSPLSSLHRGTFQLPGGDSHEIRAAPDFFDSLVSLSLQHRKRN
jgi:hypothetical protein